MWYVPSLYLEMSSNRIPRGLICQCYVCCLVNININRITMNGLYQSIFNKWAPERGFISLLLIQSLSMSDSSDPMDCSIPGFPVLQHLPELAQTHVHWVSGAIQPSWALLPLSPPAINLSQHQDFFPMSQIFASGAQCIGVSPLASVFPINIQDWFPLGVTDLISLLLKGLSGVFFNTTVQKHQFFSTQLKNGPTLTSIHDYWENHSFDFAELCWQSSVFAFQYAI